MGQAHMRPDAQDPRVRDASPVASVRGRTPRRRSERSGVDSPVSICVHVMGALIGTLVTARTAPNADVLRSDRVTLTWRWTASHMSWPIRFSPDVDLDHGGVLGIELAVREVGALHHQASHSAMAWRARHEAEHVLPRSNGLSCSRNSLPRSVCTTGACNARASATACSWAPATRRRRHQSPGRPRRVRCRSGEQPTKVERITVIECGRGMSSSRTSRGRRVQSLRQSTWLVPMWAPSLEALSGKSRSAS